MFILPLKMSTFMGQLLMNPKVRVTIHVIESTFKCQFLMNPIKNLTLDTFHYFLDALTIFF